MAHLHSFVRILVAFLLIALLSQPAQAYPERTVRLFVPFAAGGAVDAIARMMALRLSEIWNQQVIVENRAGASGVIGAEMVAKSPPDGHALLFAPSTLVVNPFVMKNYASIDPASDLRAISLVATGPLLFIVSAKADGNPTNVQEFVAAAKAHPDRHNFATGGYGSAGHLSAESFKLRTGLKIPTVLYRGTGPAITDLLGGQVSALMDPLLTSLPQVKGGGARALAITSAQPSKLAPGVPTFTEAGLPDFDFFTWYGIWTPPGVSADLVGQLEKAIKTVLAKDEMRTWFASQGLEPSGRSGEEFKGFIAREVAKYRKIIDEGNIARQ